MITKSSLQAMLNFRDARNWKQFHSARNLSTALVVESAELLEHFRWSRNPQDEAVIVRDKGLQLAHELADIAILLGYLASELSVNLDDAISEKLRLNDEKYPVEKFYGNARKYDDFDEQ